MAEACYAGNDGTGCGVAARIDLPYLTIPSVPFCPPQTNKIPAGITETKRCLLLAVLL